MGSIPEGWEIGAILRHKKGSEGIIAFLGRSWAVVESDTRDAIAFYNNRDWEWDVVFPIPPIPEDRGTVIQKRDTISLGVRLADRWYVDGRSCPTDWQPDPAEWQQMIPKEQQ